MERRIKRFDYYGIDRAMFQYYCIVYMSALNGWRGHEYKINGVVVGKQINNKINNKVLHWLLEDGSWHEYCSFMPRSNEKLSVLYLHTYFPITAGDCILSMLDGFKGKIQERPDSPRKPS